MDFLQGLDLVKLSATGLIAFGAVYITGQFKKDLTSNQKITLHFIYFFALTFVPVNIVNIVADKIKDAVAGTLLVIGIYQGGKGIVTAQPKLKQPEL